MGFMVENLVAKNLCADDNEKVYKTGAYMRKVLNVILNQSHDKFGMKYDKGRTFEAILTTSKMEPADRKKRILPALEAVCFRRNHPSLRQKQRLIW